jgi:integrase
LDCHGYVKTTRESYTSYFFRFFDSAETNGLEFDSLAAVNSFLLTLTPSSKVVAYNCLSRYFTWRIHMGLAPSSPMALIPRPRYFQKPVQGLLRADLVKVWDLVESEIECHHLSRSFAALRMKCYLVLMIFHGIRSGEIRNLSHEHWSRTNAYLIVKRKRGQVIRINLDPDVNDLLIRYDAMARSRPQKSQGALFVSWHGKRLNRNSLYKSFNRLCKRAGVHMEIGGPHQLRNTLAGIMLEDGDSLIEIGNYLGHQKASSTDKYLAHHFGKPSHAGRAKFESLLDASKKTPKGQGEVLRLVNDDEDVPF